jgi:hypothetical protein
MGGYLVPFTIVEPRRHRVHFVEIEMYPPTLLRAYWLPVALELSLLEVAAISKIAPSSLYTRVAKRFRSVRRRGARLVFDRDEFLMYDLPELDPYCVPEPRPLSAAAAWPRSRRRGRHRADCDRRETEGKCPIQTTKAPMPNERRTRRAPRWTARRRTTRPAHGKPTASDAREKEPQPEQSATPHRPTRTTRTEAYLRRLAGGDEKRYQDLVIEYSDEVAADRAAGRFEPTKNKN